MNSNNTKSTDMNLEQLVHHLKNEDARYSRLSKAFQYIYWIFIPLYSFLAIREFLENSEIEHLIGGLFFVAAFFIFALFFRMYHIEYKSVDYSLPTLTMLKQAAYRYQPFQKRTLWILLAILFMDAGLCLNAMSEKRFIDVQIVFLGAMSMATLIGLLVWKIKYKPLRDNALKLIAEIENS